MNLLLFPTLALALALATVTEPLARRVTRRGRVLFTGVAVVLAIPAMLFDAYYLHLFDNAAWFYAFRALPYTELTAAGAGVLAGLIPVLCGLREGRIAAVVRVKLLVLLVFALTVPYLKMIITPANPRFVKAAWSDGVCQQSLESSCGPASGATLARLMGVRLTERQLVRESFTTQSGTENWYLARALRRHGVPVHYRIASNIPTPLPYPAIAGTRLHAPDGVGHFIVIMGKTGDTYRVGDPILGELEIAENAFEAQGYYLTGFFLVASPRR